MSRRSESVAQFERRHHDFADAGAAPLPSVCDRQAAFGVVSFLASPPALALYILLIWW